MKTRENKGELSLDRLFDDLRQGVRDLVATELKLAKAELHEKTKEMRAGAVRVAAGGVIAYAGAILLLLSVALGLAFLLHLWLSWAASLWIGTLVVAAGTVAAGTLVLKRGLSRLKGENLAPKKTLEALKENKEWLKDERR